MAGKGSSFTTTICERPWKVRRKRLKPDADGLKIYGECHHDKQEIRLDPRQDREEMLDTAIHEVLHAVWPSCTEEVVATTARAVTQVLWKLGCRPRRW